jgi:hypothetical protein
MWHLGIWPLGGKPRVARNNPQSGAALIVGLLITVLIAGIAAVVITITTTETLISGAHRHVAETTYAADAAFERALAELAALPAWSPLLLAPPANLQSSFVDGQSNPVAPDGRQLDLLALTRARQADSDTRQGTAVFGADRPQWRLFAHTSLAGILPAGTPAPQAYLLVWVADDGTDGDGDACSDTNNRVLVHAEAYGSGAARRSVEALIGRTAEGILQVLSWRARQ